MTSSTNALLLMTVMTKNRWERLDEVLASDKEWFALNKEVASFKEIESKLSSEVNSSEWNYKAACVLFNTVQVAYQDLEICGASNNSEQMSRLTFGFSPDGVIEIMGDSLEMARKMQIEALQKYAKAQQNLSDCQSKSAEVSKQLYERRVVLVGQWHDEESAGE